MSSDESLNNENPDESIDFDSFFYNGVKKEKKEDLILEFSTCVCDSWNSALTCFRTLQKKKFSLITYLFQLIISHEFNGFLFTYAT